MTVLLREGRDAGSKGAGAQKTADRRRSVRWCRLRSGAVGRCHDRYAMHGRN